MAGVEDVRRAALILPEAVESSHMGTIDFRVGGKIFATLHPEKNRAVLKLPKDRQALLFEARPEVFTPAVWGRLVWAYAALPKLDADELPDLLASAWSTVAPRRLLARG